jgi:hypothetical protein
MRSNRFECFVVGLLAVAISTITMANVYPTTAKSDENASTGNHWLDLLKAYPAFGAEDIESPIVLEFRYATAMDDNLRRLRGTYDLDAVAGQGDELDRIINLMAWVHQLGIHADSPVIPKERNAFTFLRLAKVEGKSLNCYMKTVILNEFYLAMGFASRHTHLLPYEKEAEASHYVASVYSRALGKWIMMDPDFGAYVTDGKGTILGVSEIRRYLVTGLPLQTVYAGKRVSGNPVDAHDYLEFLSEFTFKIRCPIASEFDRDSQPVREYYELIPDGYRNETLYGTIMTRRNFKILFVADEDAFWQVPQTP